MLFDSLFQAVAGQPSSGNTGKYLEVNTADVAWCILMLSGPASSSCWCHFCVQRQRAMGVLCLPSSLQLLCIYPVQGSLQQGLPVYLHVAERNAWSGLVVVLKSPRP